MTKEEAILKFNEVNNEFQKLRLQKNKLEELGVDTRGLDAQIAYNNGQLVTLREFIM